MTGIGPGQARGPMAAAAAACCWAGACVARGGPRPRVLLCAVSCGSAVQVLCHFVWYTVQCSLCATFLCHNLVAFKACDVNAFILCFISCPPIVTGLTPLPRVHRMRQWTHSGLLGKSDRGQHKNFISQVGTSWRPLVYGHFACVITRLSSKSSRVPVCRIFSPALKLVLQGTCTFLVMPWRVAHMFATFC